MGKKKGKGKSQEGASSSAEQQSAPPQQQPAPPQQQPAPPQQQPAPPQQQPAPPQQQPAQGDSQQGATKKKGGKGQKAQKPAEAVPSQELGSQQTRGEGKEKSPETQSVPLKQQQAHHEPQSQQASKKKGGKGKKQDQAGQSEQQKSPPPSQDQEIPQTGFQQKPAWGQTQQQTQRGQAQYSPQHQPPQGHPGQPPQVHPGQPQRAPWGQPQQGHPGQPPQGYPGQPPQGFPGQPPQGYPGQPPQGYPGQPPQGYPGQPPQGYPGQPPQGYPGQPPQGYPGQPPQGHPGQPLEAQRGPPQQVPMGQPQHPPQTQWGQEQRGQPQAPWGQAQRGQSQYPPPQQQPQMVSPQHQPQGGRGRGRPQQGQPPHPHQAQVGQPQYPPTQQQQPQVVSPQHQPQGGRGRPQQGQPPQPVQQQPQQQPQGAKGKGRQQGQTQSTQQTRVSPPTQQLAKLQVGELPPMKYNKYPPGTEGRKIKVETNHLQLSLGKLRSAIHYDVNLVPDTPKKFLRHVVELFRQRHFPKRYPAFDGRKNLYSTTRLPFGDFISDEIVYREGDGRDKTYKVEIKFANEVDLSPLHNFDLSRETPREALQVVDIVLRSAPALNLITVGRSFFAKPSAIIDLGEGMEMYNGFYQSAIRGWKPFLNVDVAHKAFPKNISVTDALVELFDSYYHRFARENLNSPLDSRQKETFEKYIKTLRVTYEIPGIPSSKRSYRVNGIDQAPKDKKFKLDSGRELTIENYFATEKRYRLKYSHLPTLWVGDRNRPNKILLPLELCVIEQNQVLNRKMTENQTSNMIKHAATNTEIRKNKIKTALNQANHNRDQSVMEFGFSIANEFEKLDARILTPPSLVYNNNVQDKPFKGVWRGNKFFIGVEINKWTIACAIGRPPRPDELSRLADMIFRTSSSSGMRITAPAEQPYVTMGQNVNDIKKFFHTQKPKNYDVIFVVVPNSGQQYSYVKSAAEINSGCLTQCIKQRTLGKLNPQTVTNILLKVNAKLNGTNHCLLARPPIMNRPCMIMGADVTHPSPDSQGIPSVAAVTASHDPKAFKYNICWRLQPPKVEIIEDLEAITLEQLKYFYENNKGMKPERIVFFRDGVSEGQFDQVRHAEIRAIRSACKKIQASDYEPKITFLVVQKRHHTRLFPTNPRDSEDRNMNVPAGTCVDNTITHPFMQDFYLVSHASIQGVAKPTKYCTLWDDNDMSNDEIEALTYHLCHMFTRCNRSVSYPAPTYYAHLAAARAKVYIENDRIDLDNLQREFAKYPIQDVIRKGKPMFFV